MIEPPKIEERYPLPEYAAMILLEVEAEREGFLRAWLQQNKIDPSDAAMVIHRDKFGTVRTWFEAKPKDKPPQP